MSYLFGGLAFFSFSLTPNSWLQRQSRTEREERKAIKDHASLFSLTKQVAQGGVSVSCPHSRTRRKTQPLYLPLGGTTPAFMVFQQ